MLEPARKIRRSSVKNIVRFPSVKSNGGKSILESKYCLHLEFDKAVASYSPQPQTFRLNTPVGPVRYTPDFLVNYHSGLICYVEVKPLLQSLKSDYQNLFTCFRDYIETPNVKFIHVDENMIYQKPLINNYEFLYKFLKRPEIDMGKLISFSKKFPTCVHLKDLINEISKDISIGEVYTWLALGYLYFDMSKEMLNFNTEVSFNEQLTLD